eukprot:365148-Chlamydomonas_euryale.AAC.12
MHDAHKSAQRQQHTRHLAPGGGAHISATQRSSTQSFQGWFSTSSLLLAGHECGWLRPHVCCSFLMRWPCGLPLLFFRDNQNWKGKFHGVKSSRPMPWECLALPPTPVLHSCNNVVIAYGTAANARLPTPSCSQSPKECPDTEASQQQGTHPDAALLVETLQEGWVLQQVAAIYCGEQLSWRYGHAHRTRIDAVAARSRLWCVVLPIRPAHCTTTSRWALFAFRDGVACQHALGRMQGGMLGALAAAAAVDP